jgi:hypothetical protein
VRGEHMNLGPSAQKHTCCSVLFRVCSRTIRGVETAEARLSYTAAEVLPLAFLCGGAVVIHRRRCSSGSSRSSSSSSGSSRSSSSSSSSSSGNSSSSNSSRSLMGPRWRHSSRNVRVCCVCVRVCVCVCGCMFVYSCVYRVLYSLCKLCCAIGHRQLC